MTTRALLALILLSGSAVAGAEPAGGLDALLAEVRQARSAEAQRNAEREQRFLVERDSQKQRLKETKSALAAEDKRSDALQQAFDRNEAKLAELEKRLRERSGSFLELTGVVRQVAGDAKAIFQSSLVATQIGNRAELMSRLSRGNVLPSLGEFEDLWFALQQEMTESGKVVSYRAQVIAADGSVGEQRVTRVGVFNAVAGGRFLRHLPETGELQELPRQPAARYRRMASDLEQASSGILPMVVDPSRGAVLSLLVQMPDLVERVRQGKLVGYVIIAVGVIGLLIALERAVHLAIVGRRVKRQLASDAPNLKNPLGRVLAVYHDNKGADTETLELKIDEAILQNTPSLQRGLPTLKILAVIAPLLGLLGTVTGLIETFQAITLFGTGDAKLMAGGISQALVTTVLGLIAAIPLILMHSALASSSKRLLSVLEEQSTGIIARYAERERSLAVA